jgi:hypothetical protein
VVEEKKKRENDEEKKGVLCVVLSLRIAR